MKNSSQQSIPSQGDIPKNDKLQALEKEIRSYRSKMTEYELLEKQINEINSHINDNYNSKTSEGNRGFKQKIVADGKSKQASVNKKSSRQKIKIYELQKKLDKLLHEYDDRNGLYERHLEQKNKLIKGIQNNSRKIQEQRDNQQKLKQLQRQIESQISHIADKIEKQIIVMEETIKDKQSFSFQRRKLRYQLRKIRLSINRLLNGYQEEDLQLSISQQSFDSGLSNSSKSNIFEECEDNKKENEIFNHKQLNDITIWINKQNQKIDELLNKVQLCQQKSQQMVSNFYDFNKQMTSNEILAKHHKVTSNLLASKLKNYEQKINSAKQNTKKINLYCEDINIKLNKLEGERGFLRGRIGIKIEEQRLIRGINLLLQMDQQKLRERIQYLLLIRRILISKTDHVQSHQY